jgi:hypothetical protein
LLLFLRARRSRDSQRSFTRNDTKRTKYEQRGHFGPAAHLIGSVAVYLTISLPTMPASL